jgi:glycosyltransferase involved in cell wall biosynthesis
MKMRKLAVITSHPIQYNAPLFELLHKRKKIEIKVFYTWGESVLENKYDPGFGKVIEWNIPLLKGYNYEFLENIAEKKGSHHFKGIDNPHIIEAIKKFNPDAILVYGWSFKSHLKVLRYFKNKVPVLFRGDSTLLDKSSFLSSLKRNLFLRWVYRHVDIALYVGKNNYHYFKKARLKKNQLVFAPHVVDNARFECKEDDCKRRARAFRKELNISEKDLVFLFAGKMETKKDPALLLQAFSDLHFSNTAHLVMAGNGDLEEELKKKYLESDNIHFLDFQNQTQMPSVYEMADVFVLPSKGPGETWGLSVNEAMANGKAIIASDKCGCAVDLVEEGINGYIFKTGDNEDLQSKMKTIVEKGDLQKMKQNSKKKITDFTLEKVANIIENLINEF